MFNDIIDNMPGTTIKKSHVHGFGLFSESTFPLGQLLATLEGQIVPWQLHKEKQLTKEWNALPNERVLVRPYRTKYYYINHSRTPNLVIQRDQDDKLQIITLRGVSVGEELLLDYREEPLAVSYLSGHGETYL
jgi:hypothetical protein